MSTQIAFETTHDDRHRRDVNPSVRPSQVLRHAERSSAQSVDAGSAAEQLLLDLRPDRQVIANAYVNHVRRIHHKRTGGTEASRMLRILEAALHRRPRDETL